VIVGHNIAFDIGFVNAELGRLGLAGLINERIDTLGLTVRLNPGIKRPSLDNVAEQLGVSGRTRSIHRAGVDAAITGQVALRLAAQAREAGYATLDDLKALGGGLPKRPSERHSSARTVLDRRMLDDIPKRPGVYLMKNVNDEIVYVGKAKNLRDRVGSYFSQRLGQTRRMDGLIESLARIDTVVVGSELEALLLESQLIRRYSPRYNRALRSHEWYPFIRVDTANAWPRITLAKSRKDDGATYFGPFRSASSARKTVDLLNRVVPLRTCSRSFRSASSFGRPCIELDMNRCLGPCVGKANPDQYRKLVRDVIEFLDGRDDALYELLWAGLEDSARRLDFERAERLRRELRNVAMIVGSQRRIREAVERATCLALLPSVEEGAREVMLIAGGRLWAQVRVSEADDAVAVAERLATSWKRLQQQGIPRLDHDSVDDAFVLRRWLALASGTGSVVTLPEEPDWSEIVAQVRGIPLASLAGDFAALGGSADDDGDDGTPAMPAILLGDSAGEPPVYSPGIEREGA
jgi:DNA polymerase III subunit epsilon